MLARHGASSDSQDGRTLTIQQRRAIVIVFVFCSYNTSFI